MLPRGGSCTPQTLTHNRSRMHPTLCGLQKIHYAVSGQPVGNFWKVGAEGTTKNNRRGFDVTHKYIKGKKNIGSLHSKVIPCVPLNDLILVCKGLPGTISRFICPYRDVNTAMQQGILANIWHLSDEKQLEFVTIRGFSLSSQEGWFWKWRNVKWQIKAKLSGVNAVKEEKSVGN